MTERLQSPATDAPEITIGNRTRAWAIHLFTALGAVTGLISLIAVVEGRPAAALIWLGIGMVIDGLDGPLARRYRIAEVLPRVDGAVLDHVIDYMTYAVIPAMFIYTFAFLPDGWNLPGAAVVMVTALYCFANRDAKTRDNFFAGFPAAWNLIALCFYLLDLPGWFALLTVGVCAVLTFVPITFIHPFRVKALRPLTLAMTGAWSGVTLAAVILQTPDGALYRDHSWLYWGFVALSGYFLAFSLIRTVRGQLATG
jgi:phosphatidylcholine synthase